MYEVSNFGRVKSNSKRIFKMKNPPYVSESLSQFGYKVVWLYNKDYKRIRSFVHHLVLITFKSEKETDKECNHIDGNKINNHLSNLEWVSHLTNVRHAFDTELVRSGEKSHAAKLTFNDVKRIKKLISNKICQRRIAEHFGVTEATISDIKYNRSWKRSYVNRNS